MSPRSLVATLALLAVGPVAAAQSTARDTARTAPIVVTDTRTPLAAERVTSSVSVLTGAQLRAEGIATVADALRQVPGLALAQTGSYGGVTSLFIRGSESKHTKVLLDGVAANDAGGAFDFASLTTDNVERIEIVRGPASVLYGSDAMAGVVQIFTRRGSARPSGELQARGGRYGSYDVDAAVRGSGDAATYSVAGARHSTNGIQLFNSGYANNVGSGALGFMRGAGDVQLTARYTDVTLHYPTDGSGVVVDSNAVHRDDRLALGVDAGYRLASAAQLRLVLASYDVHGLSDNQPDSPGDTLGYFYTTVDRSHRRSGDLRLELGLPAHTQLTVGGRIEREWQQSATTSNYGANAFAAARRTSGVYSQLLLAPGDAYTLTVGARLEHNEQFGDFFTYRSAASLRVAEGTRLRASLGTAFREPTFMENYGGGYAIGNPDLRPEHSLSGDVGIEQAIGGWGTLGATWFANSFRDLIDYKYSATAPNYFNVARTRARGVELDGRVLLASGVHADAGFTYLDTRVVDAGTSAASTALFPPGARLARRPMHTLDVGVGVRRELGALDVRALRVGVREDNYYGPAPTYTVHVTQPAYTRVDLSGELTLVRGAALTGRLENVFDARYSEVAGYNSDFRLTDEASLGQTGYRAPGRRAFAGVRVNF